MQVRERDGGKSPYKWSGACFVELIRKEGWRNGLFQGMSSVFLREVPQFAIYYPAYEFFKGVYNEVCFTTAARCPVNANNVSVCGAALFSKCPPRCWPTSWLEARQGRCSGSRQSTALT
jgi:hypothetical protein